MRVLLVVTESYTNVSWLTRIMAALYGIWNLDFFRTLLPHICVNVDTLQALALDYAIAFYPLMLLVVTYVLIQCHICNFRIITGGMPLGKFLNLGPPRSHLLGFQAK